MHDDEKRVVAVAAERLDRARKLGLLGLITAADILTAWRYRYHREGLPTPFRLEERLVDREGRQWPGGVLELVYADRVVLAVAFSDGGRNQAQLVAYLPDGVVGAWEREFVSDCWQAVAYLKVAAYEEGLLRLLAGSPAPPPWTLPAAEEVPF